MSLPFAEWLPRQRWYAGRSRELSSAEPTRVVPLRDDIELMLVGAWYTDGSSERYQVIVRWDVAPPDEYNTVATIGGHGDGTGYDALYDPEAAQLLVRLWLLELRGHDQTGSKYYGELMPPNALMVLANGMVLDRGRAVR